MEDSSPQLDPLLEIADRDPRVDLSVAGIRQSILSHLVLTQGRMPDAATRNDWYLALAHAVRDRLVDRWIRTAKTYKSQRSRTLCYFSAEYLPGPQLCNNILNMGIQQHVKEALQRLDLNMEHLLMQEDELSLGSGGLGRLAACFLDSLATLQIPAIAYGIHYQYGMFRQSMEDGWQVEKTDNWLRFGNPWEVPRPKLTFKVGLGGHTRHYTDETGEPHVRWFPQRTVLGMAFDMPVVGYDVENANLLRLWKAEAPESFDFKAFNTGDYYAAVNEKVVSENITKVLYPNDEPEAGKELRLIQQYFMVCCSLQDMIRIYLQNEKDFEKFAEKYAVQLNDTHPALAVPELMRLLVDEHRIDWDRAWKITTATFAYTNHTLLPEALETWSADLMRRTLPRHLEIIEEINQRFLDEVRMRVHATGGVLERVSIISPGPHPRVRMAHLAFAGSHAVNGVAALHSRLLRESVMKDFADLWPQRFHNVTNGVTPRRFMLLANQPLSRLLFNHTGTEWPVEPDRLRRLEPLADDTDFLEQWRQIICRAKNHLAHYVRTRCQITLPTSALFDIQVKRIHEYKRQHLNVLHIISRYNRLKENPGLDLPARAFIFAGKAAPGYFMAKLIIKLINSVAEVINHDPDIDGRIKVAFMPNFNVKNGQLIYPAADLSEQISTAGYEASGTGNMKFAMNGALTIGTMDGANVEIREAVGAENFFLFGRTADEIAALHREGYAPYRYYEQDGELRQAIDLIANGFFSHGDKELFRPLVDNLLHQDPYALLADYRSYIHCQTRVDAIWQDPESWSRMSVLNVARMGHFSSDRAIREYADNIWKVKPVPVSVPVAPL
ncbi:MAG: glycogen/starch/alpha-glucan phosphorylase [Pseudomonadota bacterium]